MDQSTKKEEKNSQDVLSNYKVPAFILNNGLKMPAVGFGTWQIHDRDLLKKGLHDALAAGYRHFDTAPVYLNEDVIAEVLDTWINKRKLLKREDLFITSKLPFNAMRANSVHHAIDVSLKKMNLNYFDMYLIHAPFGFVEGRDYVPKDVYGQTLLDLSTDHVELWKAMEVEVDNGKTKSIGLCNFNQKQINRILSIARIPPANLQVEIHLYFQQRKLVNYCKQMNIQLTSFSSLASQSFKKKNKQKPTLLEDETLKKIALKHRKTPAQVALKYLIEKGIAVIPEKPNEAKVFLTMQITDFNLTNDDTQALDQLDRDEKGRINKFNEIFPGVERHPEFPHDVPYSKEASPSSSRSVSKSKSLHKEPQDRESI